jgi:hypothetical protein
VWYVYILHLLLWHIHMLYWFVIYDISMRARESGNTVMFIFCTSFPVWHIRMLHWFTVYHINMHAPCASARVVRLFARRVMCCGASALGAVCHWFRLRRIRMPALGSL